MYEDLVSAIQHRLRAMGWDWDVLIIEELLRSDGHGDERIGAVQQVMARCGGCGIEQLAEAIVEVLIQ